MTGTDSLPPTDKPINWRSFVVVSGLLVLCFSVPLFQLLRFAMGSELYSYIILIPFVSAYLVWLRRPRLPPAGPRPPIFLATGFIIAGAGILAAYFLNLHSAIPSAPQDNLALAMYSLVLFITGICCWFFNRQTLRAIAFPLGFLVFLAPLPVVIETGFETFLQHGSSVAANVLFQIIGTPVFREGTVFHLPGFNMQVAPECSGIHSTLALFITSLVAGHVLLHSTRNQVILAMVVLPIALLRNGLRITTIGELCVRLGPEMIDSYIHRHGGPIFFIISLVPFSLIVILLLKIDHHRAPSVGPTL